MACAVATARCSQDNLAEQKKQTRLMEEMVALLKNGSHTAGGAQVQIHVCIAAVTTLSARTGC